MKPLELLRAVWGRDSDLPLPTRAVLTAVILHANNETGIAWPSVNLLAAETGLHRATVVRHLGELRAAGILKWTHDPGRPNRYQVDPKALSSRTERLVAEDDQSQRTTGVVAQSDRSSRTERPELPKNGPRTAQGEPPAPKKLVEIPTKDAAKTWWLTDDIRAAIAAEYPRVDVVAVARDMAAKIRAGARDPYTHRGMRKGLASWVANEAERIRKGIPGKPAERDFKAEWEAVARRQEAEEAAVLAGFERLEALWPAKRGDRKRVLELYRERTREGCGTKPAELLEALNRQKAAGWLADPRAPTLEAWLRHSGYGLDTREDVLDPEAAWIRKAAEREARTAASQARRPASDDRLAQFRARLAARDQKPKPPPAPETPEPLPALEATEPETPNSAEPVSRIVARFAKRGAASVSGPIPGPSTPETQRRRASPAPDLTHDDPGRTP